MILLLKNYNERHEVGNPHDTHTKLRRFSSVGNLTVLGHTPQRISSICSLFSMVKIIGGKNIGG